MEGPSEVGTRGRRSGAEIEQRVEAYQRSGLTRKAFCAQHKLSVGTLDKYRQRRNGTTPAREANTIVPVELVRGNSRTTPVAGSAAIATLYVELANSRRIAVSSGFDTTTLIRLVSALEEA
jgi:hypothetical protein